MLHVKAHTHHRLRSFVRRDSRVTVSQRAAFVHDYPQFGLPLDQTLLDFSAVFANSFPTFLEIGFGSGQSLLALAKMYPEKNFIAVETHKPGIGAVLLGIKQACLTNLRVWYADVVDVLAASVPDRSLQGVQIFFPDPWPKRRHHERRLIQPAFVQLLASKLMAKGELHLATDWEDYAFHMLRVLRSVHDFENLYPDFSSRSAHRPILTKFEQRALREGRSIWELQFKRRISI